MVMTRNGIAYSGQVAVTDITSFTIPDTTASPTVGNFSNVFARMGCMAIGNGTGGTGTAVAAANTDTGLEAEITTGGGERRTGTQVETWLSFTAGANGRQKAVCHWSTAWTFTADFDVSEVMVCNGTSTANTGFAVTRQVFAAAFPVVATDVLRLDVTVEHDGTFVAGGGGTKGGVITNDGLLELARLMMDPSTTRIGQDSDPPLTINAGDWESDYGLGASTKFDVIALETDGTANTTTMSALVSEATTNGGARKSGANSVGELLADPELFDTPLFNNFAGDTVQWRPAQPGFVFTGPLSVFGQAVFNGNGTSDIMLIRQIYAAPIPFDNGDEFVPVVRMLSQ